MACSNSPTSWPIHEPHGPYTLCAVHSSAHASHGLFLRHTQPCVRQDAREHITRFVEYTTACRASTRTCIELCGSATSVWVKVSPQSELMGPRRAGFALAPGILPRIGTSVAIDVLMPFHSITTTIWSRVSAMDLRRAPAKCSIRPVHRSKLQVAVCSRADASHGLSLLYVTPCGKTPENT